MQPNHPKYNKPILSVTLAGHKLGVSPGFLRKEIQAGKLPGFKVGNQWHVYVDEIDQALRKRASENVKEQP